MLASNCAHQIMVKHPSYLFSAPTHIFRWHAFDHPIKDGAGPVTDGAALEQTYLIPCHNEAGVTVCQGIEESKTPPLAIADGC